MAVRNPVRTPLENEWTLESFVGVTFEEAPAGLLHLSLSLSVYTHITYIYIYIHIYHYIYIYIYIYIYTHVSHYI